MQTSSAFSHYLRKQFESALVESVLWIEGQRLKRLQSIWLGETRQNVVFRAYAKSPEGLAETLMFANMAPHLPEDIAESLSDAKEDSPIWADRAEIHSAIRRSESVPEVFESIAEYMNPVKAVLATQFVMGSLGGLDARSYEDYIQNRDLQKTRIAKVLGRCENESLRKYTEAFESLQDYPIDYFWDRWTEHTTWAAIPTKKPTHKILRWVYEQNLIDVDETERQLLSEVIPVLKRLEKPPRTLQPN